ncbi:MAG: hypothetical protein AAF581_07935, partial [Planctomycetota bacterium]
TRACRPGSPAPTIQKDWALIGAAASMAAAFALGSTGVAVPSSVYYLLGLVFVISAVAFLWGRITGRHIDSAYGPDDE